MKKRAETSRESILASPGKCSLLESIIRASSSRVPMQQYDVSRRSRYRGETTYLFIFYLSRAYIILYIEYYYLVNFLCAGLNKRQMLSEQLQRFHFSRYTSYERIDMYLDRTRMVLFSMVLFFVRNYIDARSRQYILLFYYTRNILVILVIAKPKAR